MSRGTGDQYDCAHCLRSIADKGGTQVERPTSRGGTLYLHGGCLSAWESRQRSAAKRAARIAKELEDE